MRVFIKYEPPAGAQASTSRATASANLKVKLPASWAAGPVSKITALFVEHYNKKNPGHDADPSLFHVVAADGRRLADRTVINTVIKEHDEFFVAAGAAPEHSDSITTTIKGMSVAGGSDAASATGTAEPGQLTCRNYGCNKQYSEARNADGACTHHTGPPSFREGKKCWSCCPDRLAWDWDSFMEIGGCATGRHSTVAPAQTFAVSPTVASATATGTAAAGSGGAAAPPPAATPPPAVRSIADFNAANPDAPSSIASLVATLAKGPVASRKLVVRESDGARQCVHFGCQQFFSEASNGPTACRHHAAGPVFHEGSKMWSCCPRAKFIEFDEFLAHPGCQTGPHEAGTEA